MKESIYDFKVKDIDGNEISMATFKEKVILICNVASTCGFTPQYKGLQKLYDAYEDQGFVVLGFPAISLECKKKGNDSDIKNSAKATSQLHFQCLQK